MTNLERWRELNRKIDDWLYGLLIKLTIAFLRELVKIMQPQGEQLRQLSVRETHYPNRRGLPIKLDPTYGRIDREIQWQVNDMDPATLGQRVAMENTIQNRRGSRRV